MLRISGQPVVGKVLEAQADFIGVPVVQWFRSKGALHPPAAIPGATALQYQLSVDDLGCDVRVDCIRPYGGGVISATVTSVAINPEFMAEMQRLDRRGKHKFMVSTVPAGDARVLVVSRANIKLRLVNGSSINRLVHAGRRYD
eukprot:CAMPEP_0174705410 /NCGR_PEP_ID=MMETSP1094-20130205/8648_1 /TAXON_ID=156173 /ORGANISM="Chrysochromulina brevifilum, Strain UTEX LB 985" /LENGTH=142 /DNA_ID=CAMNT_0015903571 /DNA_START=22 /DNA_END=447 /DNA_ORIENTATION=+